LIPGIKSLTKSVVAVGNINVRSNHIPISNFNIATSVDHYIAIEVITVPNSDSNSHVINIIWPQPATMRKRVVVADGNLPTPTDAAASLHAVPSALLHSQRTINEQPRSTGRTAWNA
jgi:hypothetical protein